MIKIMLNGKSLQLPESLIITDFLTQQGFINGSFALAINKEFIPKSFYKDKWLRHGDTVDIVTPMQGG